MPVSKSSQLDPSASMTVINLAQEFDVLGVRWDFFGGQRRLRVGLGVAVEPELLCVYLPPRDWRRGPPGRAFGLPFS